MSNTTWNPSDKSGSITLTGSNLIATSTSGAQAGVRAVDKQVTGKFYWECTCVVNTGAGSCVGISWNANAVGTAPISAIAVGACGPGHSGAIFLDGATTGSTIGTIVNNTVVCIAVDCDQRLIWFRSGAVGNWNGSAGANPATGVGGILVTAQGRGIPIYPTAWLIGGSEQTTANFGDTAFVGAVPSGYTSGFTAGASVPTNAIASQALAEHWLTTDPDARITQVIAEHWASVASGNLQAVVTFVALEHWTSVAVVVPAAGGPMVTMIH